ncbi:MAG: ABC transporter ATP-binding protein [Candidatus Lindowbacteria bacterium RIFCSPLOWO2_12_FULL_62_27]|nr:MAG: ABC transporter ATP-binding protein [Candidatus Lindowbacteria bacterium RIFCSPLOWO2_12_FULL_62_27]OGH63807.1 MAG: ABC transporter ATP-binding protein [Candidatus Lindowbacteria bacterium RIFCSPLOWO2_02_FULL_62_12]
MDIAVEGIEQRYGPRAVLRGVSFKVAPGETMVIMGGSGCGKSTLLRVLSGIEKPSAGRVLYNGQDIVRMTEEDLDRLRKRWGFCFQGGALFGSLTVGENVAFPIHEHTTLGGKVVDIMVKMKLDMVGLTGFGDLYPSQISGGMAKRVALARAMALDPEVLFMDEPSAGLDPVMSAAIDQLILDLAKKTKITTILVTHEMKSAFAVADRMILLHEGVVVADGRPADMRESLDPLIRQFIDGLPDGPIPLRRNRDEYVRSMLNGHSKA